MLWASILISVFSSLGVGLVLWVVLPRGIVLSKSVLTADELGKPLYDSWQVRNESALKIRLVSVRYLGVQSGTDKTGVIKEVDLADELDGGVELCQDDTSADTSRIENKVSWSKVEVFPGETLTARVINNTTLVIKYRRAGVSGIFEQRELRVHGYV